MKVFKDDDYYNKHELYLFKIIFSSYPQNKMTEHGFEDNLYEKYPKYQLLEDIR